MNKLKWILLIIVTSLIIALSLWTVIDSKADAYDIHGNEFTLSKQKGKWVVINYWAAWCLPCIEEMPALARLHQLYSDQVTVIGVNFDRWDAVRQENFIKQLKEEINYPLFQYFPANELGLTAVRVLPTTFFINPEGELVNTIIGDKTLREFINIMGLEHKAELTSYD